MTAAVDLITYATSNGFWVFVGVFALTTILAEAVAGVLKTAVLAVAAIFKR